MKDNTMITIIPSAATTAAFKNPVLRKATADISKIGKDYETTTKKAREAISKILGLVMQSKCYEEDGFSSVQEYAAQTFGFDKSLAYQLARVGVRFYLNESETAQRAAKMLSPSNMAEITTMTDEQLETAMNAGEITGETTQKQLRETVKRYKEASGSARVVNVKKYTGSGYTVTVDAKTGTAKVDNTSLGNPVSLEELAAIYGEYKIVVPESESNMATVIFWKGNDFARFFLSKYVANKKAKAESKNGKCKTVFTPDMVKNMTDDEKAALLAALGIK